MPAVNKNILLVINPAAGRCHKAACVDSIPSFFNRAGVSFRLVVTRKDYRADAVVREEFTSEFTHLIVGGGDGTINDAINGLKDFHRPVGFIPMGSGNDFIKNLRLGNTLEDHLQTALNGTERTIDLGKSNDRYFVNGIGAGFDGQIVLNMTKNKSWFRGHAAYMYHVVRILGGYRERKVSYSIDGKPYENNLLLIIAGNGTTFGGGFKLVPEAAIADGKLHLCVIKRVHPIRRFMALKKLEKGTHGSIPGVEFYAADELIIHEGDIHGQIDGEYAGSPPFRIRLSKNKLIIMDGKS